MWPLAVAQRARAQRGNIAISVGLEDIARGMKHAGPVILFIKTSRFSSLALLYLALAACGDSPALTGPPDVGVPPAGDAEADDARANFDGPDTSEDADAASVPDARSDRATLPDGEAGTCHGVTREPMSHRLQPVACPTPRGPGDVGPYSGDECTSDAMCTAGPNGRCIHGRGLSSHRSCNYDDCVTDADCQGTAVCYCRPSATSNRPNICLNASNCRVDADCGTGGYCSLSKIPGNFNDLDGGAFGPGTLFISGYFCRTANDCCIDDADCAPNGQHFDYCLYARFGTNWQCGGGP